VTMNEIKWSADIGPANWDSRGSVLLTTVPSGSRVEQLDDGTFAAFHPDGSSQRFYLSFSGDHLRTVVEKYPAITIRAAKG
jgi:hypothetical protein